MPKPAADPSTSSNAVTLLELLDLYPRQIVSIREEATASLNSLIDDFFEHYSVLSAVNGDSPKSSELKNACMVMIEKLQYVDTLSQRLEQLENGLIKFAESVRDNPNFLKASNSEFDGRQVLIAQLKSSRMKQEREVLTHYLFDHDIHLESPDDYSNL